MINLICWEYETDPSVELHVTKIGVERFEPGLVIDRPEGIDEYLFLHFLCPVDIFSVRGRTREHPGCCILYTPGFPQRYRGLPKDLVHNWFHFGGSRAEELVTRHKIPRNEPFYPKQMEFAVEVTYQMYQERLLKIQGYKSALAILAEYFLLRVSRGIWEASGEITTPHKRMLYRRLSEIREEVHRSLSRPWSVADMAEMAGLSQSRFSVLFREFFHTSPIDDLILMRIRAACMLLSSSNYRIREVAKLCGFSSVEYFIKAFRKRMGCTPGQYSQRRSII